MVFCVKLLSTFFLPLDIACTCPATFYHYKPWQSPHKLQLVTLASGHHTPAIWANHPPRNWLYLSLLISRVNMNMGSQAAGQPEPTPCLLWIGCPKTAAQWEWEHLLSQGGLPKWGQDTNAGTCGFASWWLCTNSQVFFLHPLHQPVFPRPRFNFLLF